MNFHGTIIYLDNYPSEVMPLRLDIRSCKSCVVTLNHEGQYATALEGRHARNHVDNQMQRSDSTLILRAVKEMLASSLIFNFNCVRTYESRPQ